MHFLAAGVMTHGLECQGHIDGDEIVKAPGCRFTLTPSMTDIPRFTGATQLEHVDWIASGRRVLGDGVLGVEIEIEAIGGQPVHHQDGDLFGSHGWRHVMQRQLPAIGGRNGQKTAFALA